MNDITWPAGRDNMGGLRGKFYFVPIEDVDFTTPPTLDTDEKTVVGDITLVALKQFFEVYFTLSTGKLTYTVQGERDGKSYKNMFDFNIPGNDAANEDMVDKMLNTPGLWIGTDSAGFKRVLGLAKNRDLSLHLDYPCYIESGEGGTGESGEQKRGLQLQVSSESWHTPLYYPGAIDVDALT